MATSYTETLHAAEFLAGPVDINLTNESRTVLSGQTLKAGHVVGRVSGGTATSAAKSGGNTGNGTCVVDATTPVLAKAKNGVYRLRNITAGTNTGTFRLEDPDGIVLGDYTITGGAGGTVTVAEHIKLVITDGGTDFAAGDGFDVTVVLSAGKVKEYNPANTDGSEVPTGILWAAVDASAADTKGVVLERGPAVLDADSLTWFSGATTAQKNAALAVLQQSGIVAR